MDKESSNWAPIEAFGGYQKIGSGGKPKGERQTLEIAASTLASQVLGPSFPTIPDWPRMVMTRENSFLANMHTLCQTLQRRGALYENTFVDYYVQEVGQIIKSIRNRNDYAFLDSLSRSIREVINAGNFVFRNIYQSPYLFMYSLICGPERILVCAKETPIWKPRYLQQGTIEEWARQNIAMQFSIPYRLHDFYSETTIVIPEYFLAVDDLADLTIPEPAREIEESLEEAFFRKHFIVPPEGAEIFIKHGGDLEKFTIMERGKMLWGKAMTRQGEYLLGLDLDEGSIDSRQFLLLPSEASEKAEDKLGKILAEVYRDMVISINILTPFRIRDGGRGDAGDEDKKPKKYQWVYIPRVKRIPTRKKEGDGDVIIDRMPPRPHKVSGFKRIGNITPNQIRRIREFETRTGIRVLENLPEGYTFVKPHVRPKDALESEFLKLPKFIKRRIEVELSQPTSVRV
ncbi:hypothetical protein HY387_00910 [Candidatus Daviesbacteria bacterium]|nr:hypothetical protein [Candidatus Daviesbacteria bacterium]